MFLVLSSSKGSRWRAADIPTLSRRPLDEEIPGWPRSGTNPGLPIIPIRSTRPTAGVSQDLQSPAGVVRGHAVVRSTALKPAIWTRMEKFSGKMSL